MSIKAKGYPAWYVNQPLVLFITFSGYCTRHLRRLVITTLPKYSEPRTPLRLLSVFAVELNPHQANVPTVT